MATRVLGELNNDLMSNIVSAELDAVAQGLASHAGVAEVGNFLSRYHAMRIIEE